jgi:hypothetical protein
MFQLGTYRKMNEYNLKQFQMDNIYLEYELIMQ